MSKWPRDNQAELIRFYGDPAKTVWGQLVNVSPPFKMYYDGKLLKGVKFHRKAAPALEAAFEKIWDYYGQDQDKIDELGISKTAGTYNPRKVRGSATKWSNHAFGAAIDINAEENGFNMAGNIPRPVIAAFKSEGARWGGDYSQRKDPMHFEFCQGRDPDRTFEQWLDHYNCDPPASKIAGLLSQTDDKTLGMEFDENPKDGGAGIGEGEDIPVAKPLVPIVSASTDTPVAEVIEKKPLFKPGEVVAAAAPGLFYTVKSTFKSKISWFTGGLGTASASTAVGSDPETRSLLAQLISQPTFWLAILCLSLAIYIIYLRWREYGRGNPANMVQVVKSK